MRPVGNQKMELPIYLKEFLRRNSSVMVHLDVEEENKKMSSKKYEFWQPWVDKDEPSKQNSTKQLPTTKWKRDRRNRNEYSRKSDPKLPENFGQDMTPGSPEPSSPQPQYAITMNGQSNGVAKGAHDAPLDMSVRQRGQPPSYTQTINNPGYRSSYRPSVITQNSISRDDAPTGISMCDPIIDEHFRRSLGKDYVAIFSNNNIPKEIITQVKPALPKSTANNVIELMDSEGLTVDDHFAKALGDTWFKLKKQEPEMKNKASENPGVVTVSYS